MSIAGEQDALTRDAADSVPSARHLFCIPPGPDGIDEVAYFAGNSLGLQPRALAADLAIELDDWARLAVEGHREATHPWVDFHELLRAPLARLVGAHESEVIAMNSLTVNLHLLMASFYRPTSTRFRIVIEDSAFPSDSYAVRSHAAFRGFDPDDAIVRLTPRQGEVNLRTEDVISTVVDQADSIALLMLGGVNYLTGQFLDIPAITTAARDVGIVVGWDRAHAAGNLPLSLHDSGADFAAWCSYKYLNSGPGSLAGVFIHERHHSDRSLPRLEGWWSTDPATRFAMNPTVQTVDSADAWQVSNPPILALAPVLTSLGIFDGVGMTALRERSVRLTSHLESLLDEHCIDRGYTVLTPRDPAQRGAQLSVHVGDRDAGVIADTLRHRHGVIADTRGSHIIRLAPVPLYCTFHDNWRVVQALVDIEESR